MTKYFVEQKVVVDSFFKLTGALTIPDGEAESYPAVLIVAGSGQVDRDGNVSGFKFKLNLCKDLAEFITGLGFIVLRYDKRGVGESGGSYLKTGMWDLVNDMEACIKFLKNHPRVDPGKIIILGHSEGCILGSAYCARNPVAGLIMLGGAGENLEEALKRQRELLSNELMGTKGFKGALFRLLKVDRIIEKQAKGLMGKIRRSTEDVRRIQLVKMNVKWFREHLEYDIQEDLPRISCPVLALTGSKDFQADPEKLKNLPQLIGGETEAHIIENMTHPLKEADAVDTIMDVNGLYRRSAEKELHPKLKELLTSWLAENFAARN